MLTELVTVASADGKSLDGALYRPDAGVGRKKRGVLLAHGLTWNFYQGPVRYLPSYLTAAGYTCLALNARDHDQKEPVEFDLSYHDIQAGIDRLRAEKVDEIILLAHGYACNKAIVFPAQSGNNSLTRYVLTTLGSVKKYRPDIWDTVLAGAAKMHGRALVVQGTIDPLIEAKPRADEFVAAASGCKTDVVMLAGGDHYFKDTWKELADVVLAWCEQNP